MIGKHLALAAAAALALGTGAPAAAEPLQVERFGLYVAVDDVPAAARFYERLLGVHPQRASPEFVGFDVAGGLLAVVSRASYRLQVGDGSRVRPYLRVADVEDAFRRAQAIAPERLESPAVIQEGPFHFFRIADPEGNIVEVFALP